MVSSFKVFGVAIQCLKPIQNIVFGIVLLRMGLLWSAENRLSNLDSVALRAMIDPERESAVILFVTLGILLKLCGILHFFLWAPE